MTAAVARLSACCLDTYLPKSLPRSSLEALLENIRFPVVQIQYHLPKEAVCPREPKRPQRGDCQQCHFPPVAMPPTEEWV
ncbi:hypothetical protein FJTKL_06105 [Diaporthe vaccinii]|uniref:Uncharacterized protein n=1 Tax=Diaporthe vaccinii TaxID=105482 RepID=A0ABR4EXC8_9PEZI